MPGIRMTHRPPEINLETVQELHRFLSVGELPEATEMTAPPKLGVNKAGKVIWYLQEYLGIIPTNFEMCCSCKEFFDCHEEGEYQARTGRHYCDSCLGRS